MKIHNSLYRKANIDKIKIHEKNYYQQNKTYKLEKAKAYYHENKERVKEYRKANVEKFKEKTNCDICNRLIRKVDLSTHKKTKFCRTKAKERVDSEPEILFLEDMET